MKLLFIDIETSPILGWTWGFHQTDVLDVFEDWRLLGFGYAWNDGKVKTVYPNPLRWSYDPPGPSDRRDEEEVVMLKKLHDLLNEADVIIGHNVDKFDLRKIQAKFVEYGLDPVSPFQTVDTLKEARKYGMFTSNRLGQLGKLFGLGGKDGISMMSVQFGVLDPDTSDDSFRTMRKYNKRDVDLTRDLYRRLLPYMKRHPQLHSDGCPTCGSDDLIRRGYRYTPAGMRYVVFQCKSCKRYHQSRRAEGKVNEELR